MTDNHLHRRDWLRTASVATVGITSLVGSGTAAASGRWHDTTAQHTPGLYEQQAKLAAIEDEEEAANGGDIFGWSVAVSADGTTALVGAQDQGDGQNNTRAGKVYVYENTGNSWVQQAGLVAEDGDKSDGFGSAVALSDDGTTAVVGAFDDEDPNGGRNDNGAGSAYVFTRAGGSWTQQDKLVASDGEEEDSLGRSAAVSADGTTALIGAPVDDNGSGVGAGAVYVFEGSGGSWVQQEKLVADNVGSSGFFGWSVALSADGKTALIGAESDRGLSGSAFVYQHSGGSWAQEQKLTVESGPFQEDRFGKSVSLSDDGTVALIGANQDNENGEDENEVGAGAAYIFEADSGSWAQRQKLLANDGAGGEMFGHSVALSADGTLAFIGADKDEAPNGEDAGSAYVFEDEAGSWTQQQKLAAGDGDSGDLFGRAIAVSADGSRTLVGAPWDEDPNGENRDGVGAGSAYVFADPDAGDNSPPTANAGEDQAVAGGAEVELDATGSTDPDGDALLYSWTQTAGPDVSLNDADTATPRFVAPDADSETELVFEVTVDDGEATDTDSVTVFVERETPPALPGQDADPQDTDDDGVYEDVDGDGELSLTDIRLYYNELYLNSDSEYVQNNRDFFDLDGDGEITLSDVHLLFQKASGD